MVGDIGQPTHLHYDMFLFLYDRISSYKCMLVLTRLLHMLYVVLLVLHGISGRAFAAI